MQDEIKIIEVEPDSADLIGLIGRLDDYLAELYPPEEIFTVDLNAPTVDQITFVVAYWREHPIGCGAIKPIHNKETELKRFYVEPEFRRNGIADRILAYLEDKARTLNYHTIKLETGEKLAEAVRFYRKHGYTDIDRYGEYVDCPTSLCMEKRLDSIC